MVIYGNENNVNIIFNKNLHICYINIKYYSYFTIHNPLYLQNATAISSIKQKRVLARHCAKYSPLLTNCNYSTRHFSFPVKFYFVSLIPKCNTCVTFFSKKAQIGWFSCKVLCDIIITDYKIISVGQWIRCKIFNWR